MDKNNSSPWQRFRQASEKKFSKARIRQLWGFQVQKNTRWNPGLSPEAIHQLEQRFGFTFPDDYKEMLQVINGFDTLHISIDPDGEAEDEFKRRCYMYPDDFESTQWLIQEAWENIREAKEALANESFPAEEVEGFVPLYAHRALAVFKNKQLSPFLSIWGNDIIVYGNNLLRYWCNEFYIRGFN